MRSPACGPNWPRCAPIWRSCSTPTCRTGLRSKPIGRPRLQRLAAQRRIRGPGHRQPDRHRGPRGHRREHRGKPDHRRACRTASARGRLGAATELRRCAPQTVGGRAGGAATSRGGAAARVVSTASATAAAAGAGLAAHTRAPIRLAATATGAPARPAARTATAAAAPRAGAGRADAVDGLAACARGGTVDTRGSTGQQLGVACRARFVGSADGRERFRRRICRQETGTRAGPPFAEPTHASSPLSRPCGTAAPRPPLGTAGRRRSGTPAGAADVGRRIRGSPATRRARAAARPPPAQPEARRHRSAEDTGGQSVADLLARLQATPTGGGRRRRRDE